MATHFRPALLVTALVLSAAGATDAGAQGAGAQGVSETLAELNALGLQVEVRAAEAAGVQSATVPLTSPSGAGAASAGTTENLVQENLLDRLREILRPMFERNTERLLEDAIEGIRSACLINLTADDEGFELAFVAISLGGVTATFRPSPAFCRSAG